jgi:lysophospholipase L1-like esterase
MNVKHTPKKVLIIADSLGMPRCTPEEITDDETWCYRLSDYYFDKYNFRFFRHRGLDTTALLHHLKASISAYQNPDIVILQVGVVDCYPRALSRRHLAFIKKLPNFLQNIIHKIVKKHYQYFVSRRDNRYVIPDDFASNLKVIYNKYKSTSLYVLPIAPACRKYINRNSKIENSIDLYNKCLIDIFEEKLLKNVYKCSDINDIFLSDGHHLNAKGHDLIFHHLVSILGKA